MESTSTLNSKEEVRTVEEIWPLRISERKLLLMAVDLLLLNGAVLWLATFAMPDLEYSWSLVWERGYWFLVMSTLWLSVGYIVGVYELALSANALRSIWTTGGTALVVAGIYLFIPYLSPVLPGRRLYILLFPLLAASSVGLWRWFYATVFAQPTFQQRALVVGAGESGRMLAEAISNLSGDTGNPHEGTGYQIIGFIDDDPAKQGTSVARVPVLGESRDLVKLVQRTRPYEVVVAVSDWGKIRPQLFAELLSCRELGVPITSMSELYELVTGRVPVRYAGQNLSVVLPTARPAIYRVYLALRRLLDVVLALIGCLLLFFLIPVVWLANQITDPGDLFYRQERVGLGGRPFYVIKFRSMVMDAEKYTGAVWAEEDDPRITRMGRFLRKTRLDEVPQFWNVLKGEMSLIGPRPERPHFVTHLAKVIPFYRARHAVKPGITGWAQVKYRYGASVEDSLIKLEYDLYYIKNQSAFLDLQIMLKTVQVILGLKGR